MKKKIITLLLISVLSLVLLNCSKRIGRFTVVSSKHVNLLEFNPTKGKVVEASAVSFLSIPSAEEAIHKALQKAGPDYDLLIDANIFDKTIFLFGIITAEGVAYRSSDIEK